MITYLTDADRARIDEMSHTERADANDHQALAIAIRRTELYEGRTAVRGPAGLIHKRWDEQHRRVLDSD